VERAVLDPTWTQVRQSRSDSYLWVSSSDQVTSMRPTRESCFLAGVWREAAGDCCPYSDC
jgi:hypothetical protein